MHTIKKYATVKSVELIIIHAHINIHCTKCMLTMMPLFQHAYSVLYYVHCPHTWKSQCYNELHIQLVIHTGSSDTQLQTELGSLGSLIGIVHFFRPFFRAKLRLGK